MAEILLLTTLIATYAGKIKRFLLSLLIITIPIDIDKTFFLHELHSGGVKGLVVSLWSIFLLLLYVLWCIELWKDKKQKIDFLPKTTIPLLALLAICMLSMTKSLNVQLSMFEIIQMIKVYLLFFYIANNVKTKKDYNYLLYVLFIALFFEICLGYYQFFSGEHIELGVLSDAEPTEALELGNQTLMNISGTMAENHRYADFLVLVSSLLLGLVFTKGNILSKIIYLVLFVAGFILIILSLCRGAWLGFGIGLCMFFFLKIFFSPKKLNNLLKVLLLIFLAIAISSSFKDILSDRIFGDDHGSAESRIPMMEIGFDMIKANPILGVGINNYTLNMMDYDTIGLTYFYNHPAHCVFVQLAAEVGIPGLLVFLWFLAVIYFYAFKNLSRSDEFFRNQLIGIIVATTALFIHGFLNSGTIDMHPYILFWVFSGFVMAIDRMNQQKFNHK